MIPEIIRGVDKLDAISLDEMESVKLMNRTDTKFVFRTELLPGIFDRIGNDYKVLEVNGVRPNRYETLYYDTPDFRLFRLHQNGKANRYKIRYRKYVESDLNFFEIKFKSNKGRTIKDRIKRKEIENEIKETSKEFLEEKTPLLAGSLEPKVWVYYTRITLVNKTEPERLTIDLDLGFKFDGREKWYNNLVIAELKQSRAGASPFMRLMKEMRIKEGSMSKYCLGISMIYDHVKKNNFKPKILSLNKIAYGRSA
jgi:hypothetical protein